MNAKPPGRQPVGARGRMAAQAAVLDFWRATECFSPQTVDPVDPRKRMYSVTEGGPLPWEPDHVHGRLRLPPKTQWRYTVYLGTYSISAVHVLLERVFGEDRNFYERRLGGESAQAAVTVDHQGHVLLGNALLSQCAWAVGRTLHPGPTARDWLDGFDSDETRFHDRLAELTVGLADEETGLIPATVELLNRMTEAAAGLLGVQTVLDPHEIRVKAQMASLTADPPADDFLNSFYVPDLQKVRHAVGAGGVGAALHAYLTEPSPAVVGGRRDIRREPSSVFRRIQPENAPHGRWPSDPNHPLSGSQQFAVNEILGALSGGTGMFAVNGPPGTGKTTLLRDLIAAIVVERADRLAALANPADAYRPESVSWASGSSRRRFRPLRDTFTGSEIVVASSNNGAVQNVTDEIPALGAVHPPWRDDLDYFREVATAVLRAGQRDRALEDADVEPDTGRAEVAAWGLAAARLGNAENRRQFLEGFWWGDRTEPQPTLRSVLEELKGRAPEQTWAEAVQAYRMARRRVDHCRQARQPLYDALVRLPDLDRELNELARSAERQRDRCDAAHGAVLQVDITHRRATEELRRTSGDRTRHRDFRPGVLEVALTWGRKLREWSAEDSRLAEIAASAATAAKAAGAELAAAHREAAARDLEYRRIARRRDDADAALVGSRRLLEEARQHLGRVNVPDLDWVHGDDWERSAPWSDAQINAARSDLFAAAMDVHRSFLEHTATLIRPSLQAVVDILGGKAPRNLCPDVAVAAWRSLFLVVPVVSTTFASAGRMFGHLDAERLGWLFIDEAGQAAPQAAVGAIWRSRRVVVVGDPMQLEPVLTLPAKAEAALQRRFDVADRWRPSVTSTQGVADALSTFGTELPGREGEEGTWVGSPLRVHRRCAEPMFGVANAMAYDGMMLSAYDPQLDKPERAAFEVTVPASHWLDVRTSGSSGNLVPEEIRTLTRVLSRLRELEQPMDDVFVISPFRDTARELERVCPGFGVGRSGTVHTAQGKEADIVLLVLGGGTPGARAWVAEKPNLINVAVTRARHRIYVIGDHAAWAGLPYVADLAARLPVMSGLPSTEEPR